MLIEGFEGMYDLIKRPKDKCVFEPERLLRVGLSFKVTNSELSRLRGRAITLRAFDPS